MKKVSNVFKFRTDSLLSMTNLKSGDSPFDSLSKAKNDIMDNIRDATYANMNLTAIAKMMAEAYSDPQVRQVNIFIY